MDICPVICFMFISPAECNIFKALQHLTYVSVFQCFSERLFIVSSHLDCRSKFCYGYGCLDCVFHYAIRLQCYGKTMSSGLLYHVALVRTEVSEQCIVSIIRVTRICELGTTLAVTSNRSTLRRNTTT
jgi:hypothetical protein